MSHIGINLSSEEESFTFWKDLLTFLDFEIKPDRNHFDATDGHTSLCVQVTKPDYQEPHFHRKHTGLGHIAFQVDSADMVDSFVDSFLKPRQIETLYGGAKAYPEYTPQYYAVYFEDPDRIKVEVVYEGGWEQPAVPAPDHDRESSVTASTEPPSGTSPPAATRSIPPGCGADCCR